MKVCEMAKLLGKKAYWQPPGSTLIITVEIVDMFMNYGKPGCVIKPEAGAGIQNVLLTSLTVEGSLMWQEKSMKFQNEKEA